MATLQSWPEDSKCLNTGFPGIPLIARNQILLLFTLLTVAFYYFKMFQEGTNSEALHAIVYQSNFKAPLLIMISIYPSIHISIHSTGMQHKLKLVECKMSGIFCQLHLAIYYILNELFTPTFRYPGYPRPQHIHDMVSLLNK